jgi:hypothetical protein
MTPKATISLSAPFVGVLESGDDFGLVAVGNVSEGPGSNPGSVTLMLGRSQRAQARDETIIIGSEFSRHTHKEILMAWFTEAAVLAGKIGNTISCLPKKVNRALAPGSQ